MEFIMENSIKMDDLVVFPLFLVQHRYYSGDSWMYPYQRTPMEIPIYPYIVGVYGLLSPRIPI